MATPKRASRRRKSAPRHSFRANAPARETVAASDLAVVPGVIHGLRRWQLYLEGSRWRLGSLNQPIIWAPGEAMEAACIHHDFMEDDPENHDPPGAGCRCGIYAFHPFGDAAEAFEEDVDAPEPGYARAVGWTICGVLSAWGRIEVHQEGFRAQRARLEALFLPSNWAGSAYHEAIEAVARLYGVPAVEHESESLIETCRRRWPGLDPDLVDELLVAELEVALTPATNSLILREGETVAGAGYVVEGRPLQAVVLGRRVAARGAGAAGGARRRHRVHRRGDRARRVRAAEAGPPRRRTWRTSTTPTRWRSTTSPDRSGAATCRAGSPPTCKRDLESGRLGRARVVWHWRDLASGRRTGALRDDPAATAAGPGGRRTREARESDEGSTSRRSRRSTTLPGRRPTELD